jgi:uncharacterized PurR-regulated membrane protein YhhQ (DUF165 family)
LGWLLERRNDLSVNAMEVIMANTIKTSTTAKAMDAVKALALPVLAMTLIVVASNILVQIPFTAFGMQDYLTWGAFTYPVTFLVTDLTNRRYGAGMARRLVVVGFLIAVVLSIGLATPRMSFAGLVVPLWGSLALADFCVKVLLALLALVPYGALMSIVLPIEALRRQPATR